ncbi:MAG: D-glycero-alpha-D-manno-heptose-1,7-bisphosphate 7-phosphatase [Actinomycetota bacterium]
MAGTTPDRPAAILFDRDGTLVVDVPCNGDPSRAEPMPGAREALDCVREAGVPMAVVSNQSGIARGALSMRDVEAVHRRIEELLGPIGPLFVCPHGPDEGCDCRKPMPGLVRRAAVALGVAVERCVLIGDVGADVDAALAAGARPILVPTDVTLLEEIERAPQIAPSLRDAVSLLLG